MPRHKVYVGLHQENVRVGVVVTEPPLEPGAFLKSLETSHKVKPVNQTGATTELYINDPKFEDHITSTEAQVLKVQRLIVSHLVEQGYEVDGYPERVLLPGIRPGDVRVMEAIEEYFTREYGPIASQPADTMAY